MATVTDTEPRVEITASSGQTALTYNFLILDEDDIVVIQEGTTLTITTHYTVAGVGSGSGGTVTLVTGATLNDSIIMERDTAIGRSATYTTGGVFRAVTVEAEETEEYLIMQELERDIARAITPATASVIDWSTISFPDPVTDTCIVWNTAADALENGPTITEIANAAANAAATAADLVLTNADVVLTHADVVLTNADVVSTNADVVTTTQDAIDTAADAVSTASDATDTGVDAAATDADVILTNADVVLTHADVVLTAADVVTTAAQVAAMVGTSTTSLLIAVATKVFTTQAGKDFQAGKWLLITSDADPTNYMHGQITSYSSTTLTMNITNVGGSGTLADWTITIAGTRGTAGAGSGDLLAANNLSDVASAATSFATIKQAATDSATGVIEIATDAEANTGTATDRAITPANLAQMTNLLQATATQRGAVELATQAEVDAGAVTNMAVTPETLAAYSGLSASSITQDTPFATTSGATASFTSVPADLTRIDFDLVNVGVNTDALVYTFQIGPTGGLETSGYVAGASGGLINNAFASAVATASYPWWHAAGKAVNTVSGKVTLTREEAGSDTWIISGNLTCDNQSGANTGGMVTLGGSKTLAGEITQAQFQISAGAFDGGSINATYYS